jgi:thioredoxin 1
MAGKTVVVTDADFEQKVLQAANPVVVDFWAPLCGPCRAVAPILEELSVEYDGRLTIAKVNTDENQRWMSKFGITGIPTMIVFSGGKEVGRVVGARPKNALKEQFEAVLQPV